METTRRSFIAAAVVAGLLPSCTAAAAGQAVTPEMFGAKGDGRTNDTDAFAAMSDHLNASGGGTIVLRKTVYVVGKQLPARMAGPWLRGADIIHLSNCSGPVEIQGNGATLRAAPGLRYGRFDAASGKPLPNAVNVDKSGNAVPYSAMITIENCRGSVAVHDLELDGNLAAVVVGGRNARTGWEAGGAGIRLVGNSGPERLSRIHTHHFPQDGLIVRGNRDRTNDTVASDIVSEFNGRQACTVTGGQNFLFERCRFSRTGRGGLKHAPGAGVDIEAEGRPIRNAKFVACEFSDNFGMAMAADMGNSADISFSGCKFVGTTSFSAWPKKPGIKFTDCTFVGSISHVHGDPDPQQATKFLRCTFTDDPALSPTGQVFTGPGGQKTIALLADGQNVSFSQCRFRLVGAAVLPSSGPGVIYQNCQMSQRSPAPSLPQGTYLGANTISANAQLGASVIRGSVTLNGRLLT